MYIIIDTKTSANTLMKKKKLRNVFSYKKKPPQNNLGPYYIVKKRVQQAKRRNHYQPRVIFRFESVCNHCTPVEDRSLRWRWFQVTSSHATFFCQGGSFSESCFPNVPIIQEAIFSKSIFPGGIFSTGSFSETDVTIGSQQTR